MKEEVMQTNRKLGFLQFAILLLSLATAIIHFSLMLPKIDPMFTLNAIGFIGLAVALYFPLPVLKNYPKGVRIFFIGYTLLTILLWILIGQREMVGYLAKIIEVVLVGCLFFERP
jgi:hypothetical protein